MICVKRSGGAKQNRVARLPVATGSFSRARVAEGLAERQGAGGGAPAPIIPGLEDSREEPEGKEQDHDQDNEEEDAVVAGLGEELPALEGVVFILVGHRGLSSG